MWPGESEELDEVANVLALASFVALRTGGERGSDHDANVENRQHFLERGLGSVRRWAGVRCCLVVLEWCLVVSWWASALANAARGWSAAVKGSEA